MTDALVEAGAGQTGVTLGQDLRVHISCGDRQTQNPDDQAANNTSMSTTAYLYIQTSLQAL